MKLLVGLGNPGREYARNRHNIGFMALERIADHHRLPSWRRRFLGDATEGQIGGERVLLLKPQTYMNESGRSVGEAARFLKIALGDIVVVHDELDLAPGRIKIKIGGGNAGHNGLRSISAHLGNDFARVRLGIGHPGSKDAVSSYVLHDFAKADSAWLEPLLDAIAGAAPWLCAGDAARFQTEVARELRAAGGDAPVAREKSDGPQVRPPARPPSSHPAGERAAKRQSALAENLRKWLGRRSSS